MQETRKNTQRTELSGSVFVGNKEYVVMLTRTIPAYAPPSILGDIFRLSWGRYKPGVEVLGEKIDYGKRGGRITSEQVTDWNLGDSCGSHTDMVGLRGNETELCYLRLPIDNDGRAEKRRVKAAILSNFEKCWEFIYQTLYPVSLCRNTYFAVEKISQMDRPATRRWLREEFGKKVPKVEHCMN